jgi:NitT/TauT family transport system substrate-binding protein
MALLKKGNLTPADVTLINLRPQDMVAAMASGSIDAYNIFEPYIGNGKRALGDAVAELDTAGVYAETFNIVTTKPYLAANPAIITGFLTSLLEAEAWMTANREEAIKTVASVVNLAPADLAPIWANFIYGVRIDERTIDVLNQHAAWRLATGNHPPGAKMPDWKQVIDAGPLRAIAPGRVTAPGV